jgi:hypothetical protein
MRNALARCCDCTFFAALPIFLLAIVAFPSAAHAVSVVAPLTSDATHDGFPEISNGVIYWVRDTTTVAKWDGGIFQTLFTGSGSMRNLSSAAGNAAWSEFGTGSTIYFYDGTTTHTVASGLSQPIWNISTDGTGVAYAMWDGTDYEIWIWAGPGNTPQQITNNSLSDFDVRMDSGNAIWRGQLTTITNRIFLWNGSSTIQLPAPNMDYTNQAPAISGNYIAWNAVQSGTGFRFLYLYRINTGLTTQIDNGQIYTFVHVSNNGVAFTDNAAKIWVQPHGGSPELVGTGSLGRIDGTQTVFTQASGSNAKVFLHTIGGSAVQIGLDDGLDDHNPVIANGEIAWQSRNPADVFVYVDSSRFNGPPTIIIATPTDGSVFNPGATITLLGVAFDVPDGDLSASIEWSSDIMAGTGTGASLSTTGFIDGIHTVTASVTDSDGNLVTDDIMITVSDTPPVVTILSPANNSIFNVGDNVTLLGTAIDAEDGDGSAGLVWSSNLMVGTGTGASLSTTAFIAGVHTITASVTDSLGNPATDLITITVNTVGNFPTVTIASPMDGDTFATGAFIPFAATANDPEDGNISPSIVWTTSLMAGSGTGASFSTDQLIDGVHVITTTITDADGNTSTDSVTITVGN